MAGMSDLDSLAHAAQPSGRPVPYYPAPPRRRVPVYGGADLARYLLNVIGGVTAFVGFGVAGMGLINALSSPALLSPDWFVRGIGGAIAGGLILGWGAALLGLGAVVGMVADVARNSFR